MVSCLFVYVCFMSAFDRLYLLLSALIAAFGVCFLVVFAGLTVCCLL